MDREIREQIAQRAYALCGRLRVNRTVGMRSTGTALRARSQPRKARTPPRSAPRGAKGAKSENVAAGGCTPVAQPSGLRRRQALSSLSGLGATVKPLSARTK